jgi:hypothetical protein
MVNGKMKSRMLLKFYASVMLWLLFMVNRVFIYNIMNYPNISRLAS